MQNFIRRSIYLVAIVIAVTLLGACGGDFRQTEFENALKSSGQKEEKIKKTGKKTENQSKKSKAELER